MRALSFLTTCLIILSISAEFAMCDTKIFNWKVTNVSWSPDGVKGWVLAINGKFPGPIIKAVAGDNIVVNLNNGLQTEGLAIHWHGIRQYGTSWADGTANVTQCPIKPGENFTYNFKVDKAGTYFYHGHNRMLRTAGLYGLLIVNDTAERARITHYDGDLSLLLSDWWHKSIEEQEIDLSSKPMVWVGEAQSLLINGRGQFNCYLAASVNKSSAKPQCNLTGKEQYAPDILHVQPNKAYRLRLASATSLASLSFSIGNHTLKVVEADGNLVEPFYVDSLCIYPGQTYSVIINTNQASESYWVSVDVIARRPNTTQGLTILSYNPRTFKSPNDLPTIPPPGAPIWNDFNHTKSFAKMIFALAGSPKPPTNSNRIIQLLNTQNLINGQTKWALNNVSLVLPDTPYLASIKYNMHQGYDMKRLPERFSNHYNIMKPPTNPSARTASGLYKFNFNDTIDIILQNANALKENVSEVHPWHLHGHDFWVLGYGEGRFKLKDMRKLNFYNPPLRNTEVIFPYGWTALRFVADNPGVWAFHCHIEPHMEMGMGVVFAEGVERIGNIPDPGLRCGLRA